MGDLADPGAGPHWDALDGPAPVPAMPVIRSSEQYVGPYPLEEGASLTLGWQWRAGQLGGPVFALLSRTLIGGYKVRETFPLTAAGWAQAWDVLARLSPANADGASEVLAQRAAADRARQERDGTTPELIALDVEALAPVRGVTLLGGYASQVALPRRRFGAIVALEGLGTAAVLSSLAVRSAIKTVIRVQAASAELFLLCTGMTPQDLRIYLSRPLSEIRAARAGATAPPGPAGGAAQVENLARLAAMLDAGLITRAEFDTLKASLLGPP